MVSRKNGGEEGTMDNDDGGNLEYYNAKQNSGQVNVSKKEPTKRLTKAEILRAKSDGYVPMSASPEQKREFERYQEVTFAKKASDKAKQNPLIPIGMLATVVALTLGLRAVSRGDKWQSQMMMRARIGAQGFTIFAVLASILYAGASQEPLKPPPTTRRSPSS